MTPQSDGTSFFLEWGIKIAGFFITFVSGIVTATWIVAGKMRDIDNRLQGVESAQKSCQGGTLVRIDAKLDRIHERIDEILLKGGK